MGLMAVIDTKAVVKSIYLSIYIIILIHSISILLHVLALFDVFLCLLTWKCYPKPEFVACN